MSGCAGPATPLPTWSKPSVLHVLGAPAAAEAILATIGSRASTSLVTVNGTLSEDHRFIRASLRTCGLRAWGITEYAGIAHAIGAGIDARGGNAKVNDPITDLLARRIRT
jgi:hypothetical protein